MKLEAVMKRVKMTDISRWMIKVLKLKMMMSKMMMMTMMMIVLRKN